MKKMQKMMKQPREQNSLRVWLVLFVVSLASVVQAEDVTVTTYYPSPRGNYQTLNSTGSTNLATTAGSVLTVGLAGATTTTLVVNGNTNTLGNYLVSGTAGLTLATACTATQALGGINVLGGIVTGGTCTSLGGGAMSGSGTTNFVAKWTPSGTQLGNSSIFDDGVSVTIGGGAADLYLGGTAAQNGGNQSGNLILRNNLGTTTVAINSDTNSYFNVGNVGIGTAIPGVKLQINGAGAGTVDLRVTGRIQTGDAGNLGGVWLDNASTMFVGQNEPNVGFWTSGVGWNALQINKTTGNVGIGTTGPGQKLDVVGGNVRSDTGFCIGASCITSWPAGGGGVAEPSKSCTPPQVLQAFNVSVVGSQTCVTPSGGGGGVSGAGSINYVTKWTNSLNPGTLSTTSSIYDNGNVGIGTTGPFTKFHVRPTIDANFLVRPHADFGPFTGVALDSVNDANSVAMPMRIRGAPLTLDGNVGVTVDLSVAGQQVCRANTTITGCPTSGGGGVSPGTANFVTKYNAAGTNVMNSSIFDNGNVGIGTTAPGATLDVNGTVRLGPNAIYDNWFPYADNNAYVTGANIFLRGGSPQGWPTAVTVNTAAGTIRGATYGYGGEWTFNWSTGACPAPNPFTGVCSCPGGFFSHAVASFVGSGPITPSPYVYVLNICSK